VWRDRESEVEGMVQDTGPEDPTRRAFGLMLVLSLITFVAPVSAQLAYVGSSTIGENIIPEAAEAFAAKTGIKFGEVQTQGSGKGLDLVLKGGAPLAGVARSLSSNEKQRRLYYQIIGYDAVSVFVHRDNPVVNVTKDQLKGIFTGKITRWKQVGGRDVPIVCITQVWGAGRAQMVEFQDNVMDGAPYRKDCKEVDRQVDQVIALGAEPHGISAFSLVNARPGVRALAIDGFAPEARHIRSGAYVLSRPLILVAPVPPSKEAKQFIDFMLGAEGQHIVGRKFVPLR
jgi:phosphate transport system substrate-binding protein